jgi:diketogulonate reductase-like aldo/keto reductase
MSGRLVEQLLSQVEKLKVQRVGHFASFSSAASADPLSQAQSQILNAGSYELNDGTKHPKIGYGTYKVGYIPASATGSGGGGGDGSEARACIKDAIEVGYRFFDCAQYYGNENFVGMGFKDSGIAREELYLLSKVWCSTIFEGPAAIRAQVEKTLSDLQTSYLDLYLVHWPVPGKHIEAYKTLEKLKEEGLIRSIGLSNYTIEDYEELKPHLKYKPVVNQVEANCFLYRAKTFDYFHSQGILIQSYRSLRNGAEMNHPTVLAVAQKHDRTAAQVLGRWCVQNDIIYVPKSEKKHRMIENAMVFDFHLDKDDMLSLNGLTTEENLQTMRGQYVKCVGRDTPIAASGEGIRQSITAE